MILEPLHPVQIRRFREMRPEEKWQVSLGLLQVARETRAAALRARHPHWTQAGIDKEIAKEFIRART